MAKQDQGKRFRLLIYERMWQRWAFLSFLIIPASIAFWWYSPALPIISQKYQLLTLVPALVAAVLLIYTLLARHLAWVQCKPHHLRIQTPFYPLVVSYGRIKDVHPRQFAQVFDPTEEKIARQDWLRPYWAETAVVVELSDFPLSRAWLRLWLSPYLMKPDSPGFVFMVEDWMGLSRQLDDRRTTRDMRRVKQRRQR